MINYTFVLYMKEMTEKHVQAIWYDAAFRPRHLMTRCGTAVRVVNPGDWNQMEGPDFKNAVLEVGKDHRRVVGDVEVHLCPSDWDLHGHGSDPNYRNVIAHVTWKNGPAPQSLPAGALSIWLGRFISKDQTLAPEQIDLSAYPYKRIPLDASACEIKFGHDLKRAQQTLIEMGKCRLHMKAQRLLGRLCAAAGNRRQIFYEEVMTALGYGRNQSQFRHVAERVPIINLPRESFAARTALLVAGSFENWNRIGTRPNNTPEHRLECAADIFTTTPIMRFIDESEFSKATCQAMIKLMCENHCLGRGRAAAIIANVIVPFALAESRISQLPDWLPPEDISLPVRLSAFRLFGRDHNPTVFYSSNGLSIQGLLHVYRDFCSQSFPNCASCSMLRQCA